MIKTIIICVLYIAFTLAGMTTLKYANNSLDAMKGIVIAGIKITPLLVLGVILYATSFLIFVFFVSRLKVSIAIPLVSGIYCALTVVIGMMLFGEQVRSIQLWGVALVIIGSILVGLGK